MTQIDWRAPHCLDWGEARTRLAVALAGEFYFSGSIDQLLERAGRHSEHKSIRHWSVTDKIWRNLVSDAGIVNGPEGRDSLPDLAAADMIAGSSFYYFEVGRSGRTIYRLRVSEHTSQRFVPATDNVTPIVMAGATRCAYVNRLAAFYRHMAGRPTDSEPPAARSAAATPNRVGWSISNKSELWS